VSDWSYFSKLHPVSRIYQNMTIRYICIMMTNKNVFSCSFYILYIPKANHSPSFHQPTSIKHQLRYWFKISLSQLQKGHTCDQNSWFTSTWYMKESEKKRPTYQSLLHSIFGGFFSPKKIKKNHLVFFYKKNCHFYILVDFDTSSTLYTI